MNVVDESAPQVMVGSSGFIFGEFLHPGSQKPSLKSIKIMKYSIAFFWLESIQKKLRKILVFDEL
jgi:hypothetical protein